MLLDSLGVMMSAKSRKAGERILVAVCGSNDPNPKNSLQEDQALDGPILTALSYRRPPYDKLFILSLGGEDRQGNAMVDRARNVEILAKKRVENIAVQVCLRETDRPQDHNEVFPLIFEWFEETFHPYLGGELPMIEVDISPGTPAVHMTWILLAIGGTFPISLIRSLREEEAENGKRVVAVYHDRDRLPVIEAARWMKEQPVETMIESARRSLAEKSRPIEKFAEYGIITRSPRFAEALESIVKSAEHRGKEKQHILILGETGTGKELAAKMFADIARPGKPFRVVNAAGLRKELARSELFGHVKGAFTGADRDKKGLIRSAEEGVLFLDEIGELPPDVQAELLRFLEDGTIEPVGGETREKVDVLVVAATNRDMEEELEEKRFREDLTYRFKKRVELPPLRRRKEDIPILANHFLEIAEVREVHFTDRAFEELKRYNWPGNVRELKNIVNRLLEELQPGETEINGNLVRVVLSEETRKPTGKGALFTLSDFLPDSIDVEHQVSLLKQRLARAVLAEHPELTRGGKPNYAGLARLLNVSEGKTVKAWLSGEESLPGK